jgi:oxaloacetate decarboxylase gamma subunit
MTIVDMLGQSGVLTLLGMGTVFSFLAIVIVCVTWMGKLMHALGLDKEPEKAVVSAPAAAADGASVAAIVAAVNQYEAK